MKFTQLLAGLLVTSVIGVSFAIALDEPMSFLAMKTGPTLAFPEVKISATSSSLPDLVHETSSPALKSEAVPVVITRRENAEGTISADDKFVIKPDGSVDYKLLVKPPDESVDYRMVVKNPDTVWKK